MAGELGLGLGGLERFGMRTGCLEGGFGGGDGLLPRGVFGRVFQLRQAGLGLAAPVERGAQALHLGTQPGFLAQQPVALLDGGGVAAAGFGPQRGGNEPRQFGLAGGEDFAHAAAAGQRLNLALHRGQQRFAHALFAFLLAIAALFHAGDALAHPEQARRPGTTAPRQL